MSSRLGLSVCYAHHTACLASEGPYKVGYTTYWKCSSFASIEVSWLGRAGQKVVKMTPGRGSVWVLAVLGLFWTCRLFCTTLRPGPGNSPPYLLPGSKASNKNLKHREAKFLPILAVTNLSSLYTISEKLGHLLTSLRLLSWLTAYTELPSQR